MSDEIIKLDKQYYMNTFGDRLPVCFKKGKGLTLTADDGKEYLDFLGGIAVNALGHSHPVFVNDIKNQVENLIHTSSLYYVENQARLAEKLVNSTCANKAFFCNSGAEANEGAFKLCKMYFYKRGIPKTDIITLDSSFHGRTLATVAATGQKHYQDPYRPLTPGFTQVAPNDFEAMKAAVTEKTAGIMIELIQGESGVFPMDKEYVQKLRKLCDEKDIVLIFDEVQTGMGRTGKLFAHQLYGVEPDIFTCAKALGGGIPIGAVLAKDKFCAFGPGDHGTTFGGNPLATAAGLSVLKIFASEHLVENARDTGAYFKAELEKLAAKYPDKIVEIRGAGLLIGIEFKEQYAKPVFNKLFADGFLTSLCKGIHMRLAPPLIITRTDVDKFITELDSVLDNI